MHHMVPSSSRAKRSQRVPASCKSIRTIYSTSWGRIVGFPSFFSGAHSDGLAMTLQPSPTPPPRVALTINALCPHGQVVSTLPTPVLCLPSYQQPLFVWIPASLRRFLLLAPVCDSSQPLVCKTRPVELHPPTRQRGSHQRAWLRHCALASHAQDGL